VALRRGALCVVLVSALLATAIGTTAFGGDSLTPRRPFVGVHNLYTRADLGSYCVTSADGTEGECSDAAPPTRPPSPRLPVQPGDRVSVLFRDNPSSVDRPKRVGVSLARIKNGHVRYLGWRGHAHRVHGHPWRWRFRLPRQVKRGNFLELFERMSGGDATYGVGLRARH
jgi:hypothetical protein